MKTPWLSPVSKAKGLGVESTNVIVFSTNAFPTKVSFINSLEARFSLDVECTNGTTLLIRVTNPLGTSVSNKTTSPPKHKHTLFS